MKTELDQYLIEKKDESIVFSKFLDEESEFLEELVGGHGKVTKKQEEIAKQKFKGTHIKNYFKFKGRRKCFSINPEGEYENVESKIA